MRTKINKKLYTGKDGQLRLAGSLSFFILEEEGKLMDTKKAIELLEKDGLLDETIIKSYVRLLKQGEKYKKMMLAIQDEILSDEYEDVYGMPSRRGSIYKRFKVIEQKHFPKDKEDK